MNKKYFIKEYSKAVREGYAAVFAGAGASVGAGFIDWKTLVKPFADFMELDIEKEHDLVKIAQYYVNERGGRGHVDETIINQFSSKEKSTDTLEILTRLAISTYWTTNYDSLIEDNLYKNNRKADVKREQENLASHIYDRDAVVYKMHGDVTLPHKAVLTKDDYETYNETHALFTTALRGDLLSKTFLFVGFSFEDPNLDNILGKIKILLGKNTRLHYCLQKKVIRSDYPEDAKGSVEYNNDKVRQRLKVQDLKRYGIFTVLLETYDEIPKILEEIERLSLNKSIFVSGSISKFNEEWTNTKVDEFCYKLSKRLVENDNKIISGFGSGIGSSIINGALEEIHKNKFQHVNEHLSLHPFPQTQVGEVSIEERWTQTREDMIKESGICIFIFGNKLSEDGTESPATGMLEEYGIALNKNKVIVPVIGSGMTAEIIFEKMKEDDLDISHLEKYVELLKSKDIDELVKSVMSIITDLQN